MTQTYLKLSLEQFGERLLKTQDLDPVYTGLVAVFHGNGVEKFEQLKRWLFAYWCCYHAGLASWMSERPDAETFWTNMLRFAYNDTPSPLGGRWPRGRERRHFRGEKAVKAVDWFVQQNKTPEAFVDSLYPYHHDTPVNYSQVAYTVQKWPMFGPWIAFKVGDLLERVLNVHVRFTPQDTFYDEPVKAAVMWAEQQGITPPPTKGLATTLAVKQLQATLGHYTAPPRFERSVGLQEYETVLCKWKSHMNGGYPVGIDTLELREALADWVEVSPTASKMHDVIQQCCEDNGF